VEKKEGAMLSETLSAGLEQYRIGEKIRVLRLKKKLGLAQLSEHTGLSPAMLSKIERSQLFPTLPTLLRIALVFGVGLEHFFVENEDRPHIAVVKKEERLRLPDRQGEMAPAYFFESLNFPVTERKFEAYFAEFPPNAGASDLHAHDGSELIFVVRGALAVTIAEAETLLDAGDAMSFESSVPHSYCNKSRAACSAIVVTAP